MFHLEYFSTFSRGMTELQCVGTVLFLQWVCVRYISNSHIVRLIIMCYIRFEIKLTVRYWVFCSFIAFFSLIFSPFFLFRIWYVCVLQRRRYKISCKMAKKEAKFFFETCVIVMFNEVSMMRDETRKDGLFIGFALCHHIHTAGWRQRRWLWCVQIFGLIIAIIILI